MASILFDPFTPKSDQVKASVQVRCKYGFWCDFLSRLLKFGKPTIFMWKNPRSLFSLHLSADSEWLQKSHQNQYLRTSHLHGRLQVKISCSITPHSMKHFAFHSLLRWKMIILNSHYLTKTFLSKRLGECILWTLEWKGIQGSKLGRKCISRLEMMFE